MIMKSNYDPLYTGGEFLSEFTHSGDAQLATPPPKYAPEQLCPSS